MGAGRDVMKQAGGWASAAVDTFIRPEGPLATVVELLTED